MIEVWFEPHASTLDKEADRASGWSDGALSETGMQQAKELVERCLVRGIDAIFCSDLQRAVLTAVPTANELRLPVYPDMRLRECDYGNMTGQSRTALEQMRSEYIDVPFPGGESYAQCMQRMEGFFKELRHLFDGKTVLIVGHRATQYGIEHFGQGEALEVCMAMPRSQQPGWRYEIAV